MALRLKVTNVSASSDKGPRNIFLTEAGVLLKPGDSCAVNRVDAGTEAQAAAGLLKIEEGSFLPPVKPETQMQAEEEVVDKSPSVAKPEVSSSDEDKARAKRDAKAMDKRMGASDVSADMQKAAAASPPGGTLLSDAVPAPTDPAIGDDGKPLFGSSDKSSSTKRGR